MDKITIFVAYDSLDGCRRVRLVACLQWPSKVIITFSEKTDKIEVLVTNYTSLVLTKHCKVLCFKKFNHSGYTKGAEFSELPKSATTDKIVTKDLVLNDRRPKLLRVEELWTQEATSISCYRHKEMPHLSCAKPTLTEAVLAIASIPPTDIIAEGSSFVHVGSLSVKEVSFSVFSGKLDALQIARWTGGQKYCPAYLKSH